MKSYSQHGEDLILKEYFKDKIGTFLDLGANDGITLSNTYLFYELGWEGLMVEGSPYVFERLNNRFENEDRVQCLNVFLSDKEGLYDFYHNTNHHVNPNIDRNNMDLLSTIDINSYQRAKDWGFFEKKEIFCHTFAKVVELSKIKKYDLISIDIEGMDYNVLSQINLEETETECLIIEHNDNISDKNKIIDYCSKFGLTNILFDNSCNIILAKKK
jgi:FkbM family methyltransferase